MTQYQYDLFVIGAGSGGVRAGRFAAQYGARVAIAEDLYMGGTCVNVGCVPKKLFMYAAQFDDLFRDASGFGWQVQTSAFDWSKLLANKNAEIERLNGIYTRLLETSGVQIYRHRASFVDANTIRVGDETVTAKNILIATGGWPWVPEFPGRQHVITSNELFYLDRLPARAVVVGGGYIALEFASILNGMGSEVTLCYRGELPLRGFDREMREHLMSELHKKGVTLRFEADIERIERKGDDLHITMNASESLVADCVLYATGRRPRVQGLGLQAVGVACDNNGHIVVDEYFQTSVQNIYAIGDVIGGAELTPVALAQGMAVAKTLFRAEPTAVDLTLVPTAIFTSPSFASVGLSEDVARERFNDISVFTSSFTQLKHTLAGNSEKTLMKLVVDKVTDRVLGAHMVGPDAAELIQGLAVAMSAGATKAHFDATLGIHPSAAEEFVTMRTAAR
ncbi:MAG TPA: glutathione-disulfide reductase [Spongiibacteraceae bacterium]|nr:glutathione-disulfide reductase [Spongiibacteraceae bacterium]